MRFDNPINKHKFRTFTDIAEFSELKNEFRNNSNYNLNRLRKFLKKKRFSKF